MKMNTKMAVMVAAGCMAAAFSSTSAFAAFAALTNKDVVVQTKTLTGQVGATANAVWTLGANLVANDTIRLDIVGAKFDKTNAVTLTPNAGTVGILSASNAGAVGQTSATWRVTAAIAAASTLTFNTFGLGVNDLTGLAKGGKVTYKITITSTGSNVSIDGTPASTATAVTGVDLLSSTVTSGNAIADVTTSYGKFTAASATTTTSETGVLTTTANAAATAAIGVGSEVITLTGDFSGVSSVTAAAGKITGFDGTVNKTANEFFINAAKTSAIARNTATQAAAAVLAVAPVLVIDGTTAQIARNITASVAISGDATYSNHTSLAATKQFGITRDGFSFQTLLAGSTSANQIIIRDLSGTLAAAGGAINVSVRWFDAAGASLGTASGVMTTKLMNNGQVVTNASTILTEIGAVVPAASFATFDFAVETSKGAAANKKAVAGVGLDSTVTSQASGTVL